MKQVFTDPSVVPCDAVKSFLEASGIQAIIKNERGSTVAGVGEPVPWMPSAAYAWPEVWVSDNEYEAAKMIVVDMDNQESSTAYPWICNRCNMEVNEELNVCWNCDTPRSNNEKRAVDSDMNGEMDKLLSDQPGSGKSVKLLFKSPLFILSLLFNLLLAYLYFSPHWKHPEDYEIYDSNGIRLGSAEWNDNKMFPHKWLSYSTNGKVLSISFDNNDLGRQDRLEVPHETCRDILTDKDTDGVYENLLVKFNSGAIREFQDIDQNGFFEKSFITLADGKVFYTLHSNRTGLELEVRNSSRKLLSAAEIKRLDAQL